MWAYLSRQCRFSRRLATVLKYLDHGSCSFQRTSESLRKGQTSVHSTNLENDSRGLAHQAHTAPRSAVELQNMDGAKARTRTQETVHVEYDIFNVSKLPGAHFDWIQCRDIYMQVDWLLS